MRLIDADTMITDLLTVDPRYETMIDWCCRVLEAQPTVDAVPVIRCKDCKHWTVTCDDDYQSCECDALIRHKDFYCAMAERKDNGETD